MKKKLGNRAAGGVAAVASAFRYVTRASGIVRGVQALCQLNQKDGVDCPGCAWPDPDPETGHGRSMFEFCENGAKAIAEEITTQRAGPEFFSRHSVAELREQSDYWLGLQGRLTHPLILKKGESHYRPISWDDAFDEIAKSLRSLASPDQATFYTSGRTSNEAAFLYQLMVRSFGTNNLPDCSNLCHESSGVALTESLGFGKGSVTLEDFDHADCILVVGQNPGTNHPRMLTALQRAARNGCQIVSINPLLEAGTAAFKNPQEVGQLALGGETPLASLHIPLRIGTDLALFQGIAKWIFEKDAVEKKDSVDRAFLSQHTVGFEDYVRNLRETSWQDIVQLTGLSLDQIASVASLVRSAKRMIVCWAMGLTQHLHAVATIQEVVHLLLLGGHLGRKGAGVCPVRGHSNVQGDRTMGIYEKMPDAFLDRLGKEFQFNPPRVHGLDAVASIEAMLAGRCQAFVAMGGNFLSACPDTDLVGRALSQCVLTVSVSTKLNRTHLYPGETSLVLPCLGRTEQDLQSSGLQLVTMENSMGIVHSSIGKFKPASEELKSEVAIVAGMASPLLGESAIPWAQFAGDYRKIREAIERVIPGFDQYNARISKHSFFYLPHPVRDRLEFRTESKKAQFFVHPLSAVKEDLEIPNGLFKLMTLRSHDQFNTTIYGLNDRYRGVRGERKVVFMNLKDLEQSCLKPGDLVQLESHFEGQVRSVSGFKVIPYEIPQGCVASYFPEANPVIPIGKKALKSHTPAYKSVCVKVRRMETL